MTLPLSEIERLAEIKSKATPGEWSVRDSFNIRAPDPRGGFRCPLSNSSLGDERKENFTFIAESHNAFDALLATAREALDLARESLSSKE